jgi:hypothetical protein
MPYRHNVKRNVNIHAELMMIVGLLKRGGRIGYSGEIEQGGGEAKCSIVISRK